MSGHPDSEERLLSVAEREIVALTKPPGLSERTKGELQALGKRLREARDRARRVGRQQKREIRGKSEPRAATPARDNAGTEAKAELLVEAPFAQLPTASAPAHRRCA